MRGKREKDEERKRKEIATQVAKKYHIITKQNDASPSYLISPSLEPVHNTLSVRATMVSMLFG